MNDKPKSWREVLLVHPAAEEFEMMNPDELKALGEDIKKNGINQARARLAARRVHGGAP
jgi:hypothetical protein